MLSRSDPARSAFHGRRRAPPRRRADLEQTFVIAVINRHGEHEASLAGNRAARRICELAGIVRPECGDAARFGGLHGVDRAKLHAIWLELARLLRELDQRVASILEDDSDESRAHA